jgi:hypothetical protein
MASLSNFNSTKIIKFIFIFFKSNIEISVSITKNNGVGDDGVLMRLPSSPYILRYRPTLTLNISAFQIILIFFKRIMVPRLTIYMNVL